MLSSIFTGARCAQCRNCCVFEEQSAWELPLFSAEAVSRLADRPAYTVTEEENGRFRVTLPYDETHAAQQCPFLNEAHGCVLPAEEKPFACSLWPVRLMPDAEGNPKLALYQGCPGIPEEKLPKLYALLDSGLRDRIYDEAARDPSLILPYHPNYVYL